MFDKALAAIEKRRVPETLSHIEKYHPSLPKKLTEAEDLVDRVWGDRVEGKADLAEFREVLKRWYRLNLEGILIYKRVPGVPGVEE